jgi:hypothetical protein
VPHLRTEGVEHTLACSLLPLALFFGFLPCDLPPPLPPPTLLLPLLLLLHLAVRRRDPAPTRPQHGLVRSASVQARALLAQHRCYGHALVDLQPSLHRVRLRRCRGSTGTVYYMYVRCH